MPAAIPIIAAAISTAGTAYAAHSASSAADENRAAIAPLQDEQARLARQQRQQGTSLFSTGLPLVNQATNYYQTLLRGSGPALTRAIAPEVSQISDTYRGAQLALDRMQPGGARDYAAAELTRDRAGRIASLVPGARAGAAAALGNIGTSLINGSSPALGGAGSVYSDLIGGRRSDARYDTENQFTYGQAFGSIISDALRTWQSGRQSASPYSAGVNNNRFLRGG